MDEWKITFGGVKPLLDFNATSSSDLLYECEKVGCDFFFAENSYLDQIREKKDILSWDITDCSNNCSPLNLLALERAGVKKVVVDSLERIESLKESKKEFTPILQVALTKSIREMGCEMDQVSSIFEGAAKIGAQLDSLCFVTFEDSDLANTIRSILSILDSLAAIGQSAKKVMIIGAGIQKLLEEDIATLALLKDLSKKVELAIEASRFFTEKAYTIYTRIIGKKVKHFGEIPHYLYYTDNGVYCSFYNRHINNEPLNPIPIRLSSSTDESLYESTLFGPTCDSIDTLGTTFMLPDLEVGDWLKFEECGYLCSNYSPQFNGFEDPAETLSR